MLHTHRSVGQVRVIDSLFLARLLTGRNCVLRLTSSQVAASDFIVIITSYRSSNSQHVIPSPWQPICKQYTRCKHVSAHH